MGTLNTNNYSVQYAIHDRFSDIEQNMQKVETSLCDNINTVSDELNIKINDVEHKLNETINSSWNDMFHRLDNLRVLCYHRFILNITLSIINLGLVVYILLR